MRWSSLEIFSSFPWHLKIKLKFIATTFFMYHILRRWVAFSWIKCDRDRLWGNFGMEKPKVKCHCRVVQPLAICFRIDCPFEGSLSGLLYFFLFMGSYGKYGHLTRLLVFSYFPAKEGPLPHWYMVPLIPYMWGPHGVNVTLIVGLIFCGCLWCLCVRTDWTFNHSHSHFLFLFWFGIAIHS